MSHSSVGPAVPSIFFTTTLLTAPNQLSLRRNSLCFLPVLVAKFNKLIYDAYNKQLYLPVMLLPRGQILVQDLRHATAGQLVA